MQHGLDSWHGTLVDLLDDDLVVGPSASFVYFIHPSVPEDLKDNHADGEYVREVGVVLFDLIVDLHQSFRRVVDGGVLVAHRRYEGVA